MVDFPSAVAVPPTSAYGPPQVDFNWLANLGTDYYKGKQNQFQDQQNQQTTALQQAFKGGIPTNPDGSINYQAMVQTLAQKGDINAIAQFVPQITDQQQQRQARQFDPSLVGGAAPVATARPQPQPVPQQPGDLPPASAGLARPTGTAQPSGPSPSGPTVAAIVSSVVPNGEMAGKVSANVARALGVDPSTPLSEEQQARAVNVVRSYAQRRGGSSTPPPQMAATINTEASDYGLDPSLLTRQIGQESRFNPNATSPAGAKGLAQFMPKTAQQYGVDVANDKSSITGAAHYDSDLLKQFGGNQGLAIAAYNWGPAKVQRWLQAGADPNRMPKETRNYVQAITGRPIQDWTGAVRQPANPNQRVAQGFGMVGAQPTGQPPVVPGQAPPVTAIPPQPSSVAPIAAQGPVQAAALPPQAAPTQGAIAPPQTAAQPQRGPIGPQVPLPVDPRTGRQFTDPMQAILWLNARAGAAENNPKAKGWADYYSGYAKLIENSIKPMEISRRNNTLRSAHWRTHLSGWRNDNVAGSIAGRSRSIH